MSSVIYNTYQITGETYYTELFGCIGDPKGNKKCPVDVPDSESSEFVFNLDYNNVISRYPNQTLSTEDKNTLESIVNRFLSHTNTITTINLNDDKNKSKDHCKASDDFHRAFCDFRDFIQWFIDKAHTLAHCVSKDLEELKENFLRIVAYIADTVVRFIKKATDKVERTYDEAEDIAKSHPKEMALTKCIMFSIAAAIYSFYLPNKVKAIEFGAIAIYNLGALFYELTKEFFDDTEFGKYIKSKFDSFIGSINTDLCKIPGVETLDKCAHKVYDDVKSFCSDLHKEYEKHAKIISFASSAATGSAEKLIIDTAAMVLVAGFNAFADKFKTKPLTES